MGAIFQRGDTWYISYRHKGQRHREAVGPTKALATQVLAKRTVEIAEGKFFPQKIKVGMTFVEMADKWITEYSEHRKKSHAQDKYTVAKLKEMFPYTTLESFTPLMIEQMRAKIIANGFHPLTANRYHQTIRAIFNKAKQWGLMSGDNPASKVKLANERKYWRTRYLSQEELGRLLATIEDPKHCRLRPIVLTALYTGMRRGEIEGIRKQHVNLERREIFLPDTKNDEPAYIPIPETLASVLDPILARLEGSQDRVFNYARFTHRWNRIRKQAGLEDFRFHDLRHTFASYITMATGDLAATQRLLRHRMPTMTQRYTHHAPKFLRGIVNQLDTCFGPKLAPQPQPAALLTGPLLDGQVVHASASATP
ncbi:MAG: tyrosine-type recombinase/integrase [Elusimicrobia bacterium]|nr:tyrosine-type recombinase/integrase [Elusimicrobiota bacterium]